MIKINNINEITPNMDKNATLKDIALHINELIKLEGKDKVIEKAGIDKIYYIDYLLVLIQVLINF